MSYAKAFAALLGAIGTWGVTAFEDGSATNAEWFGLLVAVGTAVAVWATANERDG